MEPIRCTESMRRRLKAHREGFDLSVLDFGTPARIRRGIRGPASDASGGRSGASLGPAFHGRVRWAGAVASGSDLFVV